MKLLLDTNILIHREARTVVRDDIGALFNWADRLKYEKWVHQGSISEIERHADEEVRRTFSIKLGSYSVLQTTPPETPEIAAIRADDHGPNDQLDTSLVAELAAGRVDALITEDRGIHRKARRLGLATSTFTIDSFLEKVTAENPDLSDYKVLSVRKVLFGNIDLRDPFFDSFREDYPGFDSWFNRKSEESAYVCSADEGRIVAFLYVKREEVGEDYSDITPAFSRMRRLKIGTFKVVSNGYKLGERFLKIIFDNARRQEVEEIYVTIFRKRSDQDRLIRLLEDWGFSHWGTKSSSAGSELVLCRDFRPQVASRDPRHSYPYLSRSARKFVVPIYPDYHTELLPDSILNTESPADFVENRPNRNAISKVYISRSFERDLAAGDIVVFYRTKSGAGPAHYTSVATTIGVVQQVTDSIQSKAEFIAACRKRSVFSDADLAEHWDYNRFNRPFVVNFLYVYSLPRRPNLKQLKEHQIIVDAPRGFERITDEAFSQLLELAGADQRLIID